MPIGTRVRLASGGPEMLIVDLDGERMQVLCAWGPRSEMWLPVVCVDVIRRFHIIDDLGD